ncbi:MAG: NADH-quinone oxidoreductase subunit NuoN [Rhodospirillales bacterium]|jgi:NADH-quinone oxidoreductase subunit N|nr:NADH-quinone oxidoreductase subunit NuoN [Rhodospirillales bacterium]
MPLTPFPSLFPALPELFLICAAMALLMVGAFRGEGSARLVSWLAVLALVVTIGLVVVVGPARQVGLNGLFITDGFAFFMKVLVLIGSALSIVMSMGYNEREGIARFEFPVLILLATLGMLMMISAHDLISLYIGLELQSLALYVCAAFKRDSVASTEAGLKYFVLGALSSGMLLYGCSLIYGFSGTTSFDQLAQSFAAGQASTGIIVGIVFVSVGLAFKCSAVPFHMWTPDVYQGAPTPVTAFFSIAPKVAAVALFIRFLVEPFGGLAGEWRQIIQFIAIASMLLGAFAAINQRNIKRLMAYSSIGHVGYALIGLAAGTEDGITGVLIYMAIYIFMNVGTFAVILSMRRNGKMVEGIDELAGLGKTQPAMALALGIFMFSMAGIPPLAGFFSKLYVFMAAINAGLVPLAIIGVVSSVVGAFYYLRIVKLMYFDEPTGVFDRPIGREIQAVLIVAATVVMLFFIVPAPLVSGAGAAAASLFPG